MLNYLALLFVITSLTACGGGASGGGNPSGLEIPVGSVSGVTFDGLILNADVKIYDFSTGSKGALLAQATSDSTGRYSVSLKEESRPVLIEVGGGSYVEEAGSNANIVLTADHKLTAVANYTAGDALTVAVTTYSHLAAGLAAYQIGQGIAVSTAINNANLRASNLAGVNILTTMPKGISNISNASATLTPELRYGFLAGAISLWTYKNAPNAAVAHIPPYTSIDFAQLLYSDITADGLLDGIGLDSTGAAAPLSFGTTPLGVDVYRLGIGTTLVQIAGNSNNKTGLTGAQVLSFAQDYVSNTDALFGSILPATFAPQSIVVSSPLNNAWVRTNITVSASAASPFGLKATELLVDGVVVANATDIASPSFTVDTTSLGDGPHTVAVRTTDFGGFETIAATPIRVDNTPPTSTGSFPPDPSRGVWTTAGVASDNYSGVVWVGYRYNSAASFGTLVSGSAESPITAWYYSVKTANIRIKDAAGNCTDYYDTTPIAYSGVWALLAVGTCP